MITIIRFEMQEMRGYNSIMLNIITFFVIILIFFTHVSKMKLGPIRDAADA